MPRNKLRLYGQGYDGGATGGIPRCAPDDRCGSRTSTHAGSPETCAFFLRTPLFARSQCILLAVVSSDDPACFIFIETTPFKYPDHGIELTAFIYEWSWFGAIGCILARRNESGPGAAAQEYSSWFLNEFLEIAKIFNSWRRGRPRTARQSQENSSRARLVIALSPAPDQFSAHPPAIVSTASQCVDDIDFTRARIFKGFDRIFNENAFERIAGASRCTGVKWQDRHAMQFRRGADKIVPRADSKPPIDRELP